MAKNRFLIVLLSIIALTLLSSCGDNEALRPKLDRVTAKYDALIAKNEAYELETARLVEIYHQEHASTNDAIAQFSACGHFMWGALSWACSNVTIPDIGDRGENKNIVWKYYPGTSNWYWIQTIFLILIFAIMIILAAMVIYVVRGLIFIAKDDSKKFLANKALHQTEIDQLNDLKNQIEINRLKLKEQEEILAEKARVIKNLTEKVVLLKVNLQELGLAKESAEQELVKIKSLSAMARKGIN